jgi:hypothetical protein
MQLLSFLLQPTINYGLVLKFRIHQLVVTRTGQDGMAFLMSIKDKLTLDPLINFAPPVEIFFTPGGM